jgi:hypothetical protein
MIEEALSLYTSSGRANEETAGGGGGGDTTKHYKCQLFEFFVPD